MGLERINDYKKRIGITNEELAARSGVPKSTIDKITAGTTDDPKLETVRAIARALGCSIDDLSDNPPIDNLDVFSLPGVEPMPKMKRVPLLGTIACGEPILAVENIEDYINMPESLNCDFALRCKGDSMINARIFDGDLVFIHQQPEVENGEIAAVLIDGETTLKRVYRYENRIELRAENPTFAPLNYEGAALSAVRIIGKAMHFLSMIR